MASSTMQKPELKVKPLPVKARLADRIGCLERLK